MKRSSAIAFIIVFCSLTACNYDFIEIEKPGGKVLFSTQVEPVFNNNDNCTSCHKTGGQVPDLTTGNAYNSIVSMNLVNTTDPPSSLLYKVPDPGNSSEHTWKKYSAAEAELVLTWIEQGALDN